MGIRQAVFASIGRSRPRVAADERATTKLRQHEFRRVRLPEPMRRCTLCAEAVYLDGGRSTTHDAWHAKSPAAHLPARWQVADEMLGEDIPAGTELALVGARHQVFYEWNGSDSIGWLLEVVGGPSSGTIYFVWTHAERDESGDHDGMTWDAPDHPLWPRGLRPVAQGHGEGLANRP